MFLLALIAILFMSPFFGPTPTPPSLMGGKYNVLSPPSISLLHMVVGAREAVSGLPYTPCHAN